MLNFFKKNTAEETRVLPQGKLEISHENFKEKYGKKLTGRIYDINVGELAPTFEKEKHLPLKVHQLIRDTLDDYLNKDSELYFIAEEKVFGVYFLNTAKIVAELKIQVIRNEIARVIEDNRRRPVVENISEEDSYENAKTKLMREYKAHGTLSERPDFKEMQDWANRALGNMSTGNGFADFQSDIYKMADIVSIEYFPVWFSQNQLVSGFVCKTTAPLSDKQYDDQQAHEDLAVLGAATRQLRIMEERNEHSILIVPVHIQTICGNNTRDIYNVYCRNLGEGLRKFIVLSLKGLPRAKLNQSDWEALKAVTHHCRSIIIDTDGETPSPKDLPFINFHSFGFDLSSLQYPEERLFKIINDFDAYYRAFNKDTYIFGINSVSMLAASLGAGISYLSGTAVSPPLQRPKHAWFLNLEELYQKSVN